MGRSKQYDEFSDLDRQMNGDFFSEASAITSVEDVPASQLELSEEEQAEHYVEVRFDSDGFAYDASSEAPDEELDGIAKTAEKRTRRPEREPETEIEPLEPMPLPQRVGATEWGSAFAEMHARVQEMNNLSKPTAARYVVRAHGNLKVSSLPSGMDFIADVCVVARRVLSPALYRVWREIYYEGFGKDADRVPFSVRCAIQMRCGRAWKKAQLLPFGKYWNERVNVNNMRNWIEKLEAEEKREAKRVAFNAYQKKRRKVKMAAGRSVISVYSAAAEGEVAA